MNCPNCGAACAEGARFCGCCGAVLAPDKKGSHRVPLLIFLGLSLLGIVLFFAIPQQSASDTPWFSVSGSTLSFDESRYTGPSELTIPDTVDGQPVLVLADGCFADCDSLTTVILPDSLQAISWCAFEDCDSLRGIFIPDGVTTIDDYAFAKCDALEAISIPASVTWISPGAFYDSPSLIHIFYDGTYAEWLLLTEGYVDPDINIYCTDGNYCQGKRIP